MMIHPRDYYLLAPLSEPDVCEHGRPDHQVLIRELADALGLDLPALSATPAQVWAGLVAHVAALTERDPWADREQISTARDGDVSGRTGQ